MEYERTQMNMDLFTYLLDSALQGSKFYKLPKLPQIEFKSNKVKYTVTDIRLLNENAVHTFLCILSEVMTEPDTEEVTFRIEDETSEDTVNIIIDILMGMSYTASKGGKNGYYSAGCFLVDGCERAETEQCKTITFKLVKENAQAIYEYAQEHEQPSLCELVIAMVEAINEKEEWCGNE